MQLKAIVHVYEEHGSPNSIPDILEALPRKISDLYTFLLGQLAEDAGDRSERAKRAFQWAIYSERPLAIDELEEALSLLPNQKAWQSPSSKLDISRLAKLCVNLVNYDEANRTVSLAHHTVGSFLLGCADRQEVTSFAIEEITTEQYLADMCLTYLSFTDFHQALTRTSDTKYLSTMDRPIRLLENVTPGFIRPWALKAATGRRSRRSDQSVDIVNVLRTELSARQSKTIDPNFQLLEYCKSYWYIHTRYIALEDRNGFGKVENFVRGTHLPKEWMPWSFIKDKDSLPLWNMFVWAVRNGHKVIFCVWQKIAEVPESRYWRCLWQEGGNGLFASACASADLTQLEIMLSARRIEDGVLRPSKSEISHELVRVSHLGHHEAVERLLAEKADVNATEEYGGRTALQAAAEGGYLAVVERLLQEKADVNAAATYGGRTALQAAAGGGHLAVVERLLQEKANANAKIATSDGRTALQAAAEGGYLQVVERLLQEKADVNAAVVYGGRTALQAAAGRGHLAVVERLLQEKANVNAAAAVAKHGRTALQAAAGGGYLAVVERLLQEKADVNAAAGDNRRTALQAAAEGGHLAVVERLLQVKADINAAAADSDGRTALQAAAEGGYLQVVERLLLENADVNAAAAIDSGRTALQAAAEGGHLAVVERLLQEKAAVDAAAAYGGRTALQAAAGGGHLAVVERLLQEKADVNAAAAYGGRTALQAAAGGGYLAVVERLLQEEADDNAAAVDNRRTALQAAAGGGYLAVVERLLQEKADVNAAAAKYGGRTALQAAAGEGDFSIVEWLREAGARQ